MFGRVPGGVLSYIGTNPEILVNYLWGSAFSNALHP
jgi:hypothetical protein